MQMLTSDPLPPGESLRPAPDPTRSGPLWVGATGVALMLAATAVLTAVRWDEIGQSAKLGGLVALTMAMLAAGRRLSVYVPMTAKAIFHLGALLVPFDTAAIATLAGWSWQRTLLVTALTGVAAWYGIERVESSVVLRWSGRLAVIAAAAGIAAVSPASAPLLLVVAAVAALALHSHRAALLWSVVAGFVPLVALTDLPVRIASAGEDLGLTSSDRWQLLAAGTASFAAIVGLTQRRPRVELAWTAVALAVVTAAVGYGTFASSDASSYLVLAAAFIAAELLALALRADSLWRPVTDVVAKAVEIGAIALTAAAALAVFTESLGSMTFVSLAIALILLGLGWLTADLRRLDGEVGWLAGLTLGGNWWLTTFMVPLAATGATWAITDRTDVMAVVLLGLAAWALSTWRRFASAVATLLAFSAVTVVHDDVPSAFALVVALAASLAMTGAARMRTREARCADANPMVTPPGQQTLLALGSLALAGMAVVFLVPAAAPLADLIGPSATIPVLMALAWMTSWAVELRQSTSFTEPAGWLGREAALLPLLFLGVVDPWAGLAMCLVVAGATAVDYKRRDSRIALAMVGSAVALTAVPITTLTDLGFARGGTAMTIAAFVVVGLMLTLPQRFELPVGSAAATLAALGLALAALEPGTFAVAVMAVGSTVILGGAALRNSDLVTVGAVGVAVGLWLQLTLWGVTWLEPYLVFPAIAALVVGHRARRNGTSSWIAYAPTIGAFAGFAELDRITGGSGWHAVIAGAVGVVAVIAGGYRRLAGPLITGTAILVVVAIYESLGPAALVPTWGWLAIGGTVLMAAAVAMERADTTPLETGQRLRHIIETQYE